MRLLILMMLTVVAAGLCGQSNTPQSDFDFWIGKWETTMSVPPAWEEKSGIDEVSYLLDGALIEEVFTKNFGDKINFQRGYLTYLRRENRWKHTIYDSKWGEYTFYGNKVGEKIILESDPLDSRPGFRREIFYNVSENSFMYLWLASYDNGETWKEEWKVLYERIEDANTEKK